MHAIKVYPYNFVNFSIFVGMVISWHMWHALVRRAVSFADYNVRVEDLPSELKVIFQSDLL